MADEYVLTPEEAQAETLMELRAIHDTLIAIKGWVVFGGIVLLISIVVSACNAILSLG